MLKILTALCFVAGLILMGSDGPWFPWINCLGGVVFAMTIPLAGRA